MGYIDDINSEVKEMINDIKNLEAKMLAGFRNERKKVYECLKATMVEGFQG